jgi:two-component system, chemotaxis family, response regulator Rcp1
MRGVLIVEDKAGDARLIREALRESTTLGLLAVLDTGQAAVAYLNRAGAYAGAPRPALILLDWFLPDEGKTLLHYLKTHPEFRRIPVVVFTGSTNPQDMLEIYALHANACILKPGDLAAYLETVQALAHYWGKIVTLPPPAKD